MYPSGSWRGFWQQEGFGRQPMEEFHLTFAGREVRGRGYDVVGPFFIRGECDDRGGVKLVKQYVAKHAVVYAGHSDGEGSILGTWTIDDAQFGVRLTGPFLMQPVRDAKTNELPIREIC